MVAINDWNDLDAVRNDLTASYTLETDLDKNSTGYTGIGDDFTPIPVSGNFNGTFDGQGYQISDLVVSIDSSNAGLFGVVNRDTTNTVIIENLSVSGSVTSTGTTDSTGGLVGILDAEGTGEIRNCVSHVDVTSDGDYVGGLVGYNSDIVTDSYATGSVEGSVNVGGLAGDNSGTVKNSYATGSVDGDSDVGGLIGYNLDVIKNSYAVGSVTGNTNVGGLVGGSFVYSTITDSYWDTQTSGQSTSADGTGLTTSEMQGDEASANMGGFDFTNTWDDVLTEDSDTSADGYPILLALDRANQLDTQGILDAGSAPTAPTNLSATLQ